MELATIVKWQQTQDVELYYCPSNHRLTFKKYSFLYSQSLHDRVRTPYFNLEAYG